MVKTLYLMRHGETVFNTQGRVQGACDSPLTDKGLAQARLAKDYFTSNSIQFDTVYSSTQERAADTARIVSGQEAVQLKGLKEMNFGQFEAQPENLLPKFRPGSRSFEDLLVPFGGENVEDVGKRVKKSIDESLQKTAAKSVLMVSHGAAMWGLCLELSLSFPEGVGFSNCAICEFCYDAGSYHLQKLILPTKDFQIISF
ncbi:histidine phosphatase family protein [Streptococcus chenjunshii]|uniref:Histidine phosphatase family protein n=1 Tax=Streptococcus chenjunshii TaxID=2173853 RepID=A0A372KP91_9STRE|nr:histidine phosphatase family protein [Streptococcus chenjunshii]AXQ78636.1 histidine phosphatase family protein [Streptococcus chenjunshii]RFU51900.1 histidine phosphatase family protein [Streptococcus chenjunshii]RFU54092.1 histidine phosphatase family protein [Streptococcus chenjunshii]